MNLFGHKPSAPRAKAAPVVSADLQRMFALYAEGYQRQFGEPPVIYKQDGPLLSGLIRKFGIEKVEVRLRAFLAWDDSYVRECAYSLDCFYRQWNKLAARTVAQAGLVGNEAANTDAYLDKMRGDRRAGERRRS